MEGLTPAKGRVAGFQILTGAGQKDAPVLVKKIGKTTYVVRGHFSETSKETMSDKIKRMLKNEIDQM